MANITAPQIIIFFTTSLLFTSVVLSWVLLQAFGVAIVGLPFELPGESALDLSTTKDTISEVGGAWTYTGGSRISTTTDSMILFNIAKDKGDGNYKSTYSISNPNQQDYSIILSSSNYRTQKIIVTNDGFHLVQNDFVSDIIGNDMYYFPYEGANQLTSVNIKTVYNPVVSAVDQDMGNTPFCIFYLNGEALFSIPHDNNFIGTPLGFGSTVYYGGVGSENNIGLKVNSYSADTTELETGVSDLWNFATTLFKILTWGIDSAYLPYEINLLLIKTQEFAIGIGIIGLFWK